MPFLDVGLDAIPLVDGPSADADLGCLTGIRRTTAPILFLPARSWPLLGWTVADKALLLRDSRSQAAPGSLRADPEQVGAASHHILPHVLFSSREVVEHVGHDPRSIIEPTRVGDDLRSHRGCWDRRPTGLGSRPGVSVETVRGWGNLDLLVFVASRRALRKFALSIGSLYNFSPPQSLEFWRLPCPSTGRGEAGSPSTSETASLLSGLSDDL